MDNDIENHGNGLPTVPVREDENDFISPPRGIELDGNEVGILKELKPDKVLEQIEMFLRGYDWDSYERKYVIKRNPLMNEKGINVYMTVLSAVSRMVTLSNYKAEEIPPRVQYVCDKVIPVIHINYKEFGIDMKSNLEILDVQLFFFTDAALRKAIGAGDRGLVRGTFREEVGVKKDYSEDYPQKSSKMFGIFPRN